MVKSITGNLELFGHTLMLIGRPAFMRMPFKISLMIPLMMTFEPA